MSSARTLKILLVEDHQDYQRLLVNALSSAGHVVAAAESKRAALELAMSASFDVVVCDYRLQDGSGVDLMKELRSRYGLRGICLSGYEQDELADAGLDSGFDRFLVKGVTFETIYAAIEGVVALPKQ